MNIRATRFGSLPIIIAAFVIGIGSGASADEGRIPIFEPVVLSGAISGQYVLTRDITLTSPGAAIQIIGTGDQIVDIDLNGFTLRDDSGGGVSGMISATGLEKLTVRNGAIVGAGAGVVGSRGVFLGATNLGDQVFVATIDGVSIRDVESGIQVSGMYSTQQLTIRRCLIRFAKWGMLIGGAGTSTQVAVIEDNLVEQTDDDGIFQSNSWGSLTLRNNRVVSAAAYGIRTQSARDVVIEGNDVLDSGLGGILVDSDGGCLVADNLAHANGKLNNTNGRFGIRVSNGSCLVRGNVATGNTGEGIRINSDGNRVHENVTTTNSQGGLVFAVGADGNSYGENTASGNTTTGGCTLVPPGGCNAPELCDNGAGNISTGANVFGGGPC